MTSDPARPKVLVVEDEILIADRIERYLVRGGAYAVVGPAVDVPEARAAFEREAPDLILLDIRLAGPETGVEFAQWLRARSPATPVVYLTSQYDAHYLELAKATLPAGYLTKPIPAPTLLATVAVVLHRASAPAQAPPPPSEIVLGDGARRQVVPVAEVCFVRADHVYVDYVLADGRTLTQRATLGEAAAALPPADFARAHRSYLVNLACVTAWTATTLTVGPHELPLSRGRRAGVLARLRDRRRR